VAGLEQGDFFLQGFEAGCGGGVVHGAVLERGVVAGDGGFLGGDLGGDGVGFGLLAIPC